MFLHSELKYWSDTDFQTGCFDCFWLRGPIEPRLERLLGPNLFLITGNSVATSKDLESGNADSNELSCARLSGLRR